MALSTSIGAEGPVRYADFICVDAERCLLGDVNGDRRADAVALVGDTRWEPDRADVFVSWRLGPNDFTETTTCTLRIDPQQNNWRVRVECANIPPLGDFVWADVYGDDPYLDDYTLPMQRLFQKDGTPYWRLDEFPDYEIFTEDDFGDDEFYAVAKILFPDGSFQLITTNEVVRHV